MYFDTNGGIVVLTVGGNLGVESNYPFVLSQPHLGSK